MYKVAVIGCGRIASGFDDDPKRKYVATHLGAYQKVKVTQVVAICDIDAAKLNACQNKWGIPRAYTDFHELLRREKVDVVSICTLPETHGMIMKEALKYPHLKAIFCEKPISNRSQGVAHLISECRRKGVVLQIDHQRRFDSLHIKLRRIIGEENYGKVQQASFYYTAGISNTGTHMFDLFRFFFGEPVWIAAVFSKNLSHKENDPNLDGWLQFRSGLTVSFQACDAKHYLVFEMDCLFEKARFVLKSSGLDLNFYKVAQSPRFSGYQELLPARNPVRINYPRNFMVSGVQHLIRCIEHKEDQLSSGRDGLAALRMIEAALHSARHNGGRVYLHSKKEDPDV